MHILIKTVWYCPQWKLPNPVATSSDCNTRREYSVLNLTGNYKTK